MTIPHQPKQVKSMWYYVFWSVATISVVLGQVYVASSYRELASALSKLLWSIATLAVVCGQIYVASSYKSLADALRLSLL